MAQCLRDLLLLQKTILFSCQHLHNDSQSSVTSFRGSNDTFWPPWAPSIHMVCGHKYKNISPSEFVVLG